MCFKERMKTIHTFLNLQGRRRELVKVGILSKRTEGLSRSTQGRLFRWQWYLPNFNRNLGYTVSPKLLESTPQDFSMFKNTNIFICMEPELRKTIINHMSDQIFLQLESRLIGNFKVWMNLKILFTHFVFLCTFFQAIRTRIMWQSFSQSFFQHQGKKALPIVTSQRMSVSSPNQFCELEHHYVSFLFCFQDASQPRLSLAGPELALIIQLI